MLLATPVAITSNTVYVASYHCTIGHYSADLNYFASKGADNPPLHALTNGGVGRQWGLCLRHKQRLSHSDL